MSIQRPQQNEYAEWYAGYVRRVPDGDIFEILENQLDAVRSLLQSLTEEQALFRFGEGEWSVKECLGHMCDAEQVFAYRALRISRGDETPLPGFDQDTYVREADFDARSLSDLLDEFEMLRRANLLVFRTLSDEKSQRWGNASGYDLTARAALFIMAGHVLHHLESFQQDYFIHF